MQRSDPTQLTSHNLREALLAIITRSATIVSAWRMLRRRGLATVALPQSVSLTVALLARRAEHNCGELTDRAISGLAALDAGNTGAGARAVASCLKMIAFDRAADRAAARLLRNAKRSASHARR